MRAAALALLLVGGPALAEDDPAAIVRALATQPGVTVTRGLDAGSPYTEWRKAGVFYRLEKHGTGDVLYCADESGAGAVMCSWTIYDEVRHALAACPADSFPVLRVDLDRDVSAMESFIVANAPLPVTAAQLRARAEAGRARAEDREARFATARRTQALACTAEAAGGLVGALEAMGPGGRRAAIDKLLATPRWPVLNPCL